MNATIIVKINAYDRLVWLTQRAETLISAMRRELPDGKWGKVEIDRSVQDWRAELDSLRAEFIQIGLTSLGTRPNRAILAELECNE